MNTTNHLKLAFSKVEGGVQAVAKACDVSPRAVYKWVAREKLPRTDYSGETAYANTIAKMPGCNFTAKELLFPATTAATQAA